MKEDLQIEPLISGAARTLVTDTAIRLDISSLPRPQARSRRKTERELACIKRQDYCWPTHAMLLEGAQYRRWRTLWSGKLKRD